MSFTVFRYTINYYLSTVKMLLVVLKIINIQMCVHKYIHKKRVHKKLDVIELETEIKQNPTSSSTYESLICVASHMMFARVCSIRLVFVFRNIVYSLLYKIFASLSVSNLNGYNYLRDPHQNCSSWPFVSFKCFVTVIRCIVSYFHTHKHLLSINYRSYGGNIMLIISKVLKHLLKYK